MKNKQYNFLPKQYDQTDQFSINHNYLSQQFSDYNVILEKVSKVVQKGDFTLGNAVSYFEDRFSEDAPRSHTNDSLKKPCSIPT